MSGKLDAMRRGAGQQRGRSLTQMTQQAAAAQAGQSESWVWLDLDQIVIDEAIQVRVSGLNPDTVEQYAVVMFEHGGWGPFPPVDVHHSEQHGGYLLSAGFHRLEAAHQASQMLIDEGKEPIFEVKAIQRPGGYDGALDFAEQDNLTNALALSSKDKQNIFERRLARGHAWLNMSSRPIAQELGVDRRTIDRWRDAWIEAQQSTGAFAPVDPRVRIGLDGKIRDTSGITAANRQRATQDPDPEPPAEEREPEMTQDELAELKARILDRLREYGGRLSPNRLRQATGANYDAYNVAIDDLFVGGEIERERDVQSGLAVYVLPGGRAASPAVRCCKCNT